MARLQPNAPACRTRNYAITCESDKRAATVLTSSGAQVLRTLSIQSPKNTIQRAPQMLSGIIQSATPMKVSTGKQDTPILPKTLHIASNPMVLSASQRIAAQHVLPASNPPKNYISPILDHSGSRKRQEVENDFVPEYNKRRKIEKVGKGLRHFSMKVCEKVRKKGTTSYNEVADELVSEFTNPALMASPSDQYDQKNIRRRVYDALNVLMAMNIISKEKKEIRWLGLPTNSMQECMNLEKEKQRRVDRIHAKTLKLQELILQQISFKSLVERNRINEERSGPPLPNTAIQLPFIIVNTSKKTVIDCSISHDKKEYLFSFDDKFEIHDDIEVLKRMGMCLGLDKGECSEQNLRRARGMVPRSLESYVVQLASGQGDQVLPDFGAGPSSSSSPFTEDLGVCELSRQSSHTSLSDPLSPSMQDFSDDESDISSDLEVN
uniref:Transcription factor n=1 Tax=Timema monikensis TaxID=170555 RepID=A0A7R9DZR9_9NEOP|nr:unnamed protein product [Timema monikensis]